MCFMTIQMCLIVITIFLLSCEKPFKFTVESSKNFAVIFIQVFLLAKRKNEIE